MKKICIGGGQGFWGDSNDAAIHMVKTAAIDYLSCDYLAELTLSIMQKQKLKNPQAGYAGDFIGLMRSVMRDAKNKNIRVISNAGGMNIASCVEELKKTAVESNVGPYKIGYVLGDDVMDRLNEMEKQGVSFENMDGDGDFDTIRSKIVNANVYFGHKPITECLEGGADAVVTGRAADPALFLAPLVHEYGWAADDWDRLAQGTVAGHLLECGGQGSGGNFQYDWRSVPDMDNLGFPIAEFTKDGLHITKAPDCGGLVSVESVKEQILYEVHDPANYITPDVVADISHAKLTQTGAHRVRISDIKGKPKPDSLKLCIGYHAGYKAVTYLSYAWPDAYEKARYASEIIMKKLKRKGLDAKEVHISFLGLNALHLDTANISPDVINEMNEVVLRMAVFAESREEAVKIVPEIAPLQLNGPPGASFFGGRAQVQEVIGLWTALVPRDCLILTSHITEVK